MAMLVERLRSVLLRLLPRVLLLLRLVLLAGSMTARISPSRMMGICKTCGAEKEAHDFYANDRTCKECRKAMVRANRAAKIEHYKAFDRARANLPHRVAARVAYQKTDAFKATRAQVTARYRHNHPGRNAANAAVAKALRSGALHPLPCQVCGGKAEAHHPDYSNFLGVVWLCVNHHAQLHAEHREYLRLGAERNECKNKK